MWFSSRSCGFPKCHALCVSFAYPNGVSSVVHVLARHLPICKLTRSAPSRPLAEEVPLGGASRGTSHLSKARPWPCVPRGAIRICRRSMCVSTVCVCSAVPLVLRVTQRCERAGASRNGAKDRESTIVVHECSLNTIGIQV